MILVTGGLGFIGGHTVRALLDAGESCVVTMHEAGQVPTFLEDELGKRVFIEPFDVVDPASWNAVGQRHRIHGIVHLAASGRALLGQMDDLRVSLSTNGILNALQAARDWDVSRVTVASTIGVYAGVEREHVPLREDLPLPMVGHHGIETAKKIDELLGSFVSSAFGLNVVSCRLSAIWGPNGRSRAGFGFSLPQMVHSSVAHAAGMSDAAATTVYAKDGGDYLYVKDCARAIALLQTAASLKHSVYNVGSGVLTTNADIAVAINKTLAGAEVPILPGHDPSRPLPTVLLDTTRLRADTGYEPVYDINSGVADYVAWLRSGHAR